MAYDVFESIGTSAQGKEVNSCGFLNAISCDNRTAALRARVSSRIL